MEAPTALVGVGATVEGAVIEVAFVEAVVVDPTVEGPAFEWPVPRQPSYTPDGYALMSGPLSQLRT